jgi:hypothetical protein
MIEYSIFSSLIQGWQGNLDISSIFVFLMICLAYCLTYLLE